MYSHRKLAPIATSAAAGIVVGLLAHQLAFSAWRYYDNTASSAHSVISISNNPFNQTETLLHIRSGSHVTGEERETVRAEIIKALKQDPIAGLNRLSEIGMLGYLSEDEIAELIKSAPGATCAGLIHVASNLREPSLVDRIYQEAFRTALQDSPREALGILSLLPRHLQKELEFAAVQATITKEGSKGFEDILGRYDLSPSNLRKGFLALCASSPQEAFAMIDRNRERLNELFDSPGGANQALISLIALGKPNPDLSLSWLKTLPPSNFVDSLVVEALSQKLSAQPSSADSLFQIAGNPELASEALAMAARRIAKAQPDVAQALIERIPSDRLRAEAYANAGRWMILSNPIGALELASAAPNPVDRAGGIAVLTQRWMDADFGKALAYAAAKAGDPAFRSVLISNLTQRIDPAHIEATTKRLSVLQQASPETKAALRENAVGFLDKDKQQVLLNLIH